MTRKTRRILGAGGAAVAALATFGYAATRMNLATPSEASVVGLVPPGVGGDGLPIAVRMVNTGADSWPGWQISTLGGLAKRAMYFPAFEIEYADGSLVMVDAGASAAFMRTTLGGKGVFVEASTARLAVDLARARALVFTHEHRDHLAGLGLLAESLVREKALVSEEQAASAEFAGEEWVSKRFRAELKRFSFDREGRYLLAPGIALERTPGHSPGSLAIDVQLRDGRRLVLIGDTTWSQDALERGASKPWVVSRFFLREDRPKVLALMRYYASVAKEAVVVSSHDGAHLDALVRAGLLLD